MLIDNRRILRGKNHILIEKLELIENDICEIIKSKSEVDTLIINIEGQSISYHSRYNPVQEAKTTLVNQLERDTEYVLLVGVGLGYLVQELAENYPHIQFSIYEPNLNVINSFLNNFNLSKVASKSLDVVFSDPLELKEFDKLYNKLEEENSKMIISPIAQKIYGNELNIFINGLKGYLSSKKKNIISDLYFQSRWTINSIINFNEVLKTPNLFKHINLEKLKNKPVLIIAAGPSLNEEIENIRNIKDTGKAYIFAVGSAVNTLINFDIIPDAFFSYDPTPENANVFKKIMELRLPIPLVFGTTISFEVLKDYPGKKVHFFTYQDSVNTNLINHNCQVIIPDAPTIASIAINVVAQIGMGPIFLVGQNLAITKEKTYADGIEYFGKTSVTEAILKKHKLVMSTTNEEIYTNDSFLDMRMAIEYVIAKNQISNRVFNTTRNGLPIEGASYVPLSTLIEIHLQDSNIVDPNIFESENNYSQDGSLAEYTKFERNFDKFIGDYKNLVLVDKKIRNAYNKKIINDTQSNFKEINKYFNSIEKNPFFLQIIAPVTRSQYKQLVQSSDEVQFEKRPLQKMEKYIKIYSKYIQTMYVAIVQIQPAFAELKKSDLFKKEDSR